MSLRDGGGGGGAGRRLSTVLENAIKFETKTEKLTNPMVFIALVVVAC